MANKDQVALVLQDEAWRRWRKENVDVTPDLSGADLRGANLRGANLRGANLIEADLIEADLSEADLCGANLVNADLVKAHLNGADLNGADLNGAYLSWAYLVRANLRGANLPRANLIEANLSGANLFDADLRDADLGRANLSGANLGEAHLIFANLREANLGDADLGGANLREANLGRANLSGANFREADLYETLFVNTSLLNVLGLEACKHLGPSILDHRTLALSGQLPLPFLRGCGLPEKFIEYLPSLLDQPIQFYSCFISYSNKDQDFADRLHADLQNNGVRCWFAPHKIQGGKKIHEQIDEAIRIYDRLLLLLSEHSMESEWVKTEIAHARNKELNQRRKVLFPIALAPFLKIREWKCVDADTGKDSAREIREYYVPDFSNWKDHESYQRAFEKLLRDLKAEDSATKSTS